MHNKTKQNKIKTYRKKIDIVDKKIIKLLDKRYAYASQIWLLKDTLGLEIHDLSREQIIFERIKKYKLDSINNTMLLQIYQEILTQFVSSRNKSK